MAALEPRLGLLLRLGRRGTAREIFRRVLAFSPQDATARSGLLASEGEGGALAQGS